MGLVLAEVSISLVLLVGAGLLFRSLMNAARHADGLHVVADLTMSVAPTGEGYRSPGADRRRIGIAWSSVCRPFPASRRWRSPNAVPMGGGMSVLAYQPDDKPEVPFNQQPLSNFVNVVAGLSSRTMGIPMVRGREFERERRGGNPRVIVINEAMARREFPDEDPSASASRSGPVPTSEPEWVEIVGVVGNMRQYRRGSGAGADHLCAAHRLAVRAQNLMILVRTAGDPMSVAGAVRAALQSARPVAAASRAAPAGRGGRRVADAAALQHDAAGRLRGVSR